jgi:glucose/arabinose dehydrogenase
MVLTGSLAACTGGTTDDNTAEETSEPPTSQPPTRRTATNDPDPTSPASTSAFEQPTTAVTVTAPPGEVELAPSSTIADDLDVPWGIGFFPDGDALVSERDTARLLRLSPDGAITSLAEVQDVTPTSEGGLLGVAVSPDFGSDRTIFAYTTTAEDNRVLAGTLEDFKAGDATAILTGIPAGEIHNGGRLAFGPDGKLYVTTGEVGDETLAPALNSLGGKILRIEPDGAVPDDNPFPDSPVWSYGHRNVQGLTWDDRGRLWASEFGSSLWDEINLVQPGRDYGWPAAEGTAPLDGKTDPAAVFTTSSASPSGLAYADGALWMAALQGETTWRVPVTASGLETPEPVRIADARTRTVVAAPDGRLWVTTSSTDGRATPGPEDDKIVSVDPMVF